MKKLIFAGLVVLLGTACTSRGNFDGSAHSAGGSTIVTVAKAVDGETGENPIEVTPSTPDYVEVRNPVEPDWDGDYGWGKPVADTPSNPIEVTPDNDRPHDDNGDGTENGGLDTGWGQERPSDNPPGDDDNGQGGHGGAQIDDRMERDSSGGIGGGQGNRPSTDNRMERQPERPTAGRPSDNRETNRRDRDHSRDRSGNATGRSVDGRARVEHF